MKKSAVVGIYIDPEFYPPTINAILCLAERFDEVVVVSRNNIESNFPFPKNVRQVKCGKLISVRSAEGKNIFYKIFAFVQFSFALWSEISASAIRLVLLYDFIPLFSWYLFRYFIISKVLIWYHNHDMPSKERLPFYSIGGLAARFERNASQKVNYFSIPSKERLQFYPYLKSNIQKFFIPNYPSLRVYHFVSDKPALEKSVRVIYQGFIGEGHALEQIIQLMAKRKLPIISLVLKGSVKPAYKQKLSDAIEKFKLQEYITWEPIGPYIDVPPLTASCHVGLALHLNTDNVSKTLGTASNKIYEYAASGLPVILFDNDHFRQHLGKYEWAFFSNGTVESLENKLADILTKLPQLSKASRRDFENELNYEYYFNPVLAEVLKAIK